MLENNVRDEGSSAENITNPSLRIDYSPTGLYDGGFNFFTKIGPESYGPGYINYALSNIELGQELNFGSVDLGNRTDNLGFSVNRTLSNGGIVNSSGNYTVNISVTVYDNESNWLNVYSDFSGPPTYYQNNIQSWSTSQPPDDINEESSSRINLHFNLPGGTTFPKTVKLSYVVFINKSIEGDMDYRPYVHVTLGKKLFDVRGIYGKGVSVNSTFGAFNINSTVTNDNNFTWRKEEESEQNIILKRRDGFTDPTAEFNLKEYSYVSTPSDSISNGAYNRNITYGLQVYNWEDASGAGLNNIVTNVTSTGIKPVNGFERWNPNLILTSNYATGNSTQMSWTFPSHIIIQESNGLNAWFETDQPRNVPVYVDIERILNQSEFNSSGYQKVDLKVKFYNTSLYDGGLQALIIAQDTPLVNVSIIPNSYTTDAPVDWAGQISAYGDYFLQYRLKKEALIEGVTYNFSAVIKVEPQSGKTVRFKPWVVVRTMHKDEIWSASPSSYYVEAPSAFLDSVVTNASAITDTENQWGHWRNNRTYIALEEVAEDINTTIVIRSPRNVTYLQSNVSLDFSVEGPDIVWTGYSLDGGGSVTSTGTGVLANLTEGPHSLTVIASTSREQSTSKTVWFNVSLILINATGNVTLPQGEYGQTNVSTDNLNLSCEVPGECIFDGNGSTNVGFIWSGANGTATGLNISNWEKCLYVSANNVTLVNNTIDECHISVDATNATNFTIIGNNISSSGSIGIFISNSNDGIITGNNFSHVEYGIYIKNSHRNQLGTNIANHGTYGIILQNSHYNTLAFNEGLYASKIDFVIYKSGFNTIVSNRYCTLWDNFQSYNTYSGNTVEVCS
jgi:parallel beta-helix repeat protein